LGGVVFGWGSKSFTGRSVEQVTFEGYRSTDCAGASADDQVDKTVQMSPEPPGPVGRRNRPFKVHRALVILTLARDGHLP
jgi:hypothetical protein